MKRPQPLATFLGVESGEGPLTAALFGLSFLVSAPFVLAYTAGNALFLADYGSGGLPYVYLASAGVMVLVGGLFARAERSLPLGGLLIGCWLALMLALGLLYGGLRAGTASWLSFATLVWALILYSFGDLAFWALVGRLLNLAQGKRLFGLVGAGSMVARLVVYSALALVVTSIGTVNLLLFALAGMLAALGLLVAILRRYGPRLAVAPQPRGGTSAARPARAGARTRYIVLIMALVLVGDFGYIFLEYFVFEQLSSAFPEPDQLARALGLFAGVAYLLASLFSAMLTGPILRRFGVRWGITSEPLLMALAMATALAAALVAPGGALLFFVIIGSKLVDEVAEAALNRPASQLLYQPLPAAERIQAQALATGIVKPVAVGVAGLLLILFQSWGITGGAPLAGFVLALSVGWLILAVFTYRGYVAALGRALSRRLVGSATLTLDAAGLKVVERALASPRSVEVLSALDLLQSERPALYAARLPALLAHPEPGVRREVVTRIGALGLVAALPAVRALASAEPEPSVRAAAVETLGRLGGSAEAALTDPAPAVRAAALVAQLRHGDAKLARATLGALAASTDPVERALAGEVAGAAGDGATVASLLQDRDPLVRRSALRSLGPTLPPELWPGVVAALADPVSRSAAMAGLAAGGPAAMPAISAALDDPALASELRVRLARACGRIRGPAASAALLRQLGVPDDQLREACVAALRRCGYAAGQAEPAIRARIAAELALAEQSAAALVDLAGEPRAELLGQALRGHLAQQQRRAFTLLGFIVEPQLARQLADGLAAPSAERRAYAAELLDTRLRPELRALFAPLVAGRKHGGANDVLPRLAALIGGPEAAIPPWVRACALYTAGLIGGDELAEPIRACRGHPSALVRELAAWAEASGGAPLAGGDVEGPARAEQGVTMLTTVERVIILKGVSIFAATPDPVLAELAALLAEEEIPAGGAIFAEGEPGSSLYIIVEGEVRVHDQTVTFNHLGERDVFGEMALLDPAPRSASVTAVSDTLLLRLDAEPFYELMDDRIEIARGIIAVLTARLRDRMRDLQEARRAQ